jgi:hypothetical protein
VQDFKYKARQYENWAVDRWTDDGRIRLKVAAGDGIQGQYDQHAEAVRAGKGWKLVLGRRVERSKAKPKPS